MRNLNLRDKSGSLSKFNLLIENYPTSDKIDDAAFQIAEVYGSRNEPDKAFEWLDQSILIRDSGTSATLGNPAFGGLRTDPRWPVFLEKFGLLEFWLEMPPEHGGPIQ